MIKRFSLFAVIFPILISMASIAYCGTYLTSQSFSVGSSGGHPGGNSSSTDMIMSDGTSWSGGAVGLQTANGYNENNVHATAANVTLKFYFGTYVDYLNTTYGAGNWTIANPQLTFQYTLYANNTRFNGGAGSFNIYWVNNDSWVQGVSDPPYATSPSGFSGWASSYALLTPTPINFLWDTHYSNWGVNGYTGTYSDCNTPAWITDKTGNKEASISYALDATQSNFVNAITGMTDSDQNISLYLMSANPSSDDLGLTIFTGGTPNLPTFSFDVYSYP